MMVLGFAASCKPYMVEYLSSDRSRNFASSLLMFNKTENKITKLKIKYSLPVILDK